MAKVVDVEKESLMRIPGIKQGKDKCALYIGASIYRAYYSNDLVEWGYTVDCLEIWKKNIKRISSKYPYFNHVYHGNVIDVVSLLKGNHYDVAMWWHGPEHIPKGKIQKTLADLEKVADFIVLGCPQGGDPQGPEYNNPYESHLWGPVPKDFKSLGYQVDIVKRNNIDGNHLTAWKKIR
jgi:hypothetical protein